jgi:hypothetical protein
MRGNLLSHFILYSFIVLRIFVALIEIITIYEENSVSGVVRVGDKYNNGFLQEKKG